MPRRKKRGIISGTFRQIFKDHPDWVEGKTNRLVLDEFFKIHPGQQSNRQKIAANLANFKSNYKRMLRKGKRGLKAGDAKTSPGTPRPRSLEQLEIRIDDVMRMAQNMGADNLDDVILHLRRARNLVVWKAGQP